MPAAFRSPDARPLFRPGDPIAADVGVGPLGLFPVTHLGIVSHVNRDGSIWVVSSSNRRGGCHEEPLADFACGAVPYRPSIEPRVDGDEAVRRARSLIGARWNLLRANCEHVTAWCAGHEPTSPQLREWGRRAVSVAAFVVTAFVALAERRAARRSAL
jgi:hypothetical protein